MRNMCLRVHGVGSVGFSAVSFYCCSRSKGDFCRFHSERRRITIVLVVIRVAKSPTMRERKLVDTHGDS